jgi:gamma-glutamyltranspeptidase/glutathione hydrolase
MIALQLLNIMSGIGIFDDDPLNPDRMHHEIEAGRLAYRDRGTCLADPAFHGVPVETIISKSYAEDLRSMIDPEHALGVLPPSPLPTQKATVYITVVDRDRNACSFINTLFYGFGSGIMAPNSGVLLQNRGMGFVVDTDHPNRVEPGKRPLHTIIPAMATRDGRAVMPFGVMGGDYQAFGHMQLLTRMFDYGMDIQMAQDVARYFPDPFENKIEVESPIPAATRKTLIKRGHNIVPAKRPIGGSQAIWIDWEQGILTGGSDPRKDGCAIGY